jgi:membrane fusion protein (multidrug efflux system)
MNKKMKAATIFLIIGLIILIFYVWKWVSYSREYAVTNAVFVKSDKIANLSFKRVGGRIKKLYFKEGDPVKEGDILALLDDKDYQIKLSEVNNQLEVLSNEKQALIFKIERTKEELEINKLIAKQNVKTISNEINALINSKKEISVRLNQLSKDRKRYKNLYEEKAVSKNTYEQIDTEYKSLLTKEKSLNNKINSPLSQKKIAEKNVELSIVKEKIIKELNAKLESLVSKIKALEKNKKDIENLISYCSLTAPFNGIIGKKFTEEGSVVNTGFPVFSLVDTESIFIYALLEETKFVGVKEGNFVDIKIDAFPKEKYSGEVEKIYPASAATYALVPRDISAGEFTKVAQRIPVKIKITEGNVSLLRVGMGGEISIKRTN